MGRYVCSQIHRSRVSVVHGRKEPSGAHENKCHSFLTCTPNDSFCYAKQASWESLNHEHSPQFLCPNRCEKRKTLLWTRSMHPIYSRSRSKTSKVKQHIAFNTQIFLVFQKNTSNIKTNNTVKVMPNYRMLPYHLTAEGLVFYTDEPYPRDSESQ